ncbi:MAG: hypothetical protein U0324_37560 [Polyangiales bacterium]
MSPPPRIVAWGAWALAFVGVACSSGDRPSTNTPPRDVVVDLAAEAAPADAPAGDVTAEPPPAPDAPAPDAAPADAPAPPDAPTTDAPPAMDAPSAMDAPPATDVAPDASVPPDAVAPDAVVPDAAVEAGACAAPMMLCPEDGGATICANVLGDTFHCGRCEVRCCGVLRCLSGTCTDVRCPPLQTACTASRPTAEGCYDAPCRDLQSDDANCGACGNACPDGTFCLRGRCEG